MWADCVKVKPPSCLTLLFLFASFKIKYRYPVPLCYQALSHWSKGGNFYSWAVLRILFFTSMRIRILLSLWCGCGSGSHLSVWCESGFGFYLSHFPRFGPSKASSFLHWCGSESGSYLSLDADPDPQHCSWDTSTILKNILLTRISINVSLLVTFVDPDRIRSASLCRIRIGIDIQGKPIRIRLIQIGTKTMRIHNTG